MGTLISAKISRKKGSNLSNGYGFVVYKTKKSAEKALRQLQSTLLDGHLLQVQKSVSQQKCKTASPVKPTRIPDKQALVSPPEPEGKEKQIDDSKANCFDDKTGSKNESEKESSIKSSKILVRNVPFEANAKEVSDVFSAFGGVKSVRMPRKMVSGSLSKHRGFAFVDFTSRSQAEKAFRVLSASTHLYGRRLVLEWAKQEVNSLVNQEEEEDDVFPMFAKQKSSLSGDMNKKQLKKSDLVTRLELSQGTNRRSEFEEDMR